MKETSGNHYTDSPLVSVVVPVYNVKNYLEKCVRSICVQTYRNLEILLVDDGSTDGSSEICDMFAARDARVRVVHQQNAGVVAARNAGIEFASGAYITFVDSDDWIDRDMYETLMSRIGGFDLITSGYYINYSDAENYTSVTDKIDAKAYEGEGLAQFFSSMIYCGNQLKGLMVNVYNKIFKTDIVKEMAKTFPPLAHFEDVLFVYSYAVKCSSILVTHECFYHYRMRENSAMHSIYKKYLSDGEQFYWHLHDIFKTHFCADILISQLQRFMSYVLCYRVGYFFGFKEVNRIPVHIFPFGATLRNKNIVLYGAGACGKDFRRQIVSKNLCNIVLWCDKRIHEKQGQVQSIEEIIACEYDYVVIAVSNVAASENIRSSFISMGIFPEKILWKKPVNFLDEVLINTEPACLPIARGGGRKYSVVCRYAHPTRRCA